MMAWVAFDRGVKEIEETRLDGPADHWRAIRDEIHAEVCREGYNEQKGAFTQFYGSDQLDSSLLMMAMVGFLPATDPRVKSTVEAIQRELDGDGLIARYAPQTEVDGLPPGEGKFLPCSFWLVDNLKYLGRVDEAHAMMDRLVGLCNDVGLLAEEYDTAKKRMTGNFPQAFSPRRPDQHRVQPLRPRRAGRGPGQVLIGLPEHRSSSYDDPLHDRWVPRVRYSDPVRTTRPPARVPGTGPRGTRDPRMGRPSAMVRQGFGIEGLDGMLGGGLLPGTLTVLAGATGAGKTQLGLRWADLGASAEGRRGIVCDLSSRGDAQNHEAYALDQFAWKMAEHVADGPVDLDRVFDFDHPIGDYFHPFDRSGRRVTRRDLDPDEWHVWKSDLARILRGSAAYFYSHFIRGCRRVVVDGIEPTERFSESIQFEFFEYLYQNALRKEDQWAAREVFRERYRANIPNVEAHRYDHKSIGCLYLYTTPHILLDDLMAQPIGEGDIFSNANTVILMGRTKEAGRMGAGPVRRQASRERRV